MAHDAEQEPSTASISNKSCGYPIYDGPDAITDDEAAAASAAPLESQAAALLDEIEGIEAVSAAGILARASALAAHNGDFGFSFDHPDTAAGRLLVALLRDAAVVAGRA